MIIASKAENPLRKQNNKISRRSFTEGVGLSVAAPYVITSTALGAPGTPPAGERVTVGKIGCGLGDVSMDEIMRVPVPLGVAFIKQNRKWQETVKQRPEGIDEWTHYLYNASGNAVSGDRLVGPTRYLKWVAGPAWSRSHEYTPSLLAMVSAGGKIFSIHDDGVRGVVDRRVGDRWMVPARDALNGLLLWKRPMSEDWGSGAWGGMGNWNTPMSIPRRLVASGDRICVTLGYRSPVTVLDAVTGKLIQELDNTQNTDEMVLIGKTLLVRRCKVIPDYSKEANAWNVQRRKGQKRPPAAPGDAMIAAINVDTGKTLWQWEDTRIVTLSLSAWKGRVCYHNFEKLVCLDLETGKLLWRTDCPTGARMSYRITGESPTRQGNEMAHRGRYLGLL